MIPVNEPLLDDEDLANVVNAVRTGWISSAGPAIESFESEWAEACGMKHGIAVANGSVALDIAVEALGLGPGDEVIMPTFTIISCAAAVVRVGAVPVLVDSEPRTWGMDVAKVEELITPRTKAIMPVHIYGHAVDMDPLIALARKHGLKIIEDAAEVHGAEYLSGRGGNAPVWQRCGGMSDISTFSFFANKLITTGEGGMVLTSDDGLAQKLRGLRNLCFRPPRRFYHTELGHNFRLTNLQAALGLAQIKRLGSIVRRKREIGARYTERLSKIKGFQLPIEEQWAKNVYWVYGMVLDDDIDMDAEEFARRLKDLGVETRPFFLGMHEQPVFHDRGLFRDTVGRYPVAERIARRGFYVPAGLAITDAQIDEVCDAVRKVMNG